MQLPRGCLAVASRLPCYCHAVATQLPRSCHAVAVRLPCRCHAAPAPAPAPRTRRRCLVALRAPCGSSGGRSWSRSRSRGRSRGGCRSGSHSSSRSSGRGRSGSRSRSRSCGGGRGRSGSGSRSRSSNWGRSGSLSWSGSCSGGRGGGGRGSCYFFARVALWSRYSRLAISSQLSCYCTAIAELRPCTRRECLDASRAAAAAHPRRVSGRRADLARARPGEGSRIQRRGDEGLPGTPWLGCPPTSKGPGSCARSA